MKWIRNGVTAQASGSPGRRPILTGASAVAASALLALTVTPAAGAATATAPAPVSAHQTPAQQLPARQLSAHQLSAQIRRTAGGVPHILAHNWASLGFGYGYAFAQDNICTMASDYVTVEAQRSRYFGPSGTYDQRASGVVTNNLDSDLFFQQIIDSHVIQKLAAALSPQVRQIQAGYVQGYNHYLASVGGPKGITDPTCRGQAWVRPITLQDSYLRFYQLMMAMGTDFFLNGIGQAAPPKPGTKPAAALALTSLRRTAATMDARLQAHRHASGSNAVAIGSAGTRNHTGMLLGNPHFPWIGTERLYQAQLTIPGKINVTGASLYGVPLILIGHNATMAWSHTDSTSIAFTLYQLSLAPGHPTEYLQDGHPVAMTHRAVTVMTRQPGGKLVPVTRTLYSTRYGPVFSNFFGQALPWTTTRAFTLRDANAANVARGMNTWFGLDRAATTGQALAVLKKYEGVPWVNTIASDKQGQALYADIENAPGVPVSLTNACNTPLGKRTYPAEGLAVLDGSRTACDWVTGPQAAAPGLAGPGQQPILARRDFVTNSNDSFWLANPHHPLTGFPRIMGDVDTPRSLRTRIGLIEVQARIDGTDGLGPPGFTEAALQHLDLSDTDYAGILTRQSLVKMCDGFQAAGGAPVTGGGTVALNGACGILAHWDLRWDTGSNGAVLFSVFWNLARNAQPSPWTHPFQVSDPVHTPSGLNTASKTVQTALGDAIETLNKAHIPLNAPPAAIQFVTYHGQHIPIPGGPGDNDGIFNVIDENNAPGDSPTAPDFGSSFIQVITWNKSACPVGRTILAYSESSNPTSPHFADQTKLFSHKQMLPDLFCQSQIMSAPHLRVTTVRG